MTSRGAFLRFLALAGGLGVTAASPMARAQPNASPPTSGSPEVAARPDETKDGASDPEAKARARAVYEKGVEAYSEGRYYEAASYFLDTNRIYPTPQLSFNVGKAYDKLGNAPGALRHYREYLRRVPDAPDRLAVTTRIRELEQALSERGVQQLTVSSTPEGATVIVDGAPVGVTPWTGELWPGRHRLALTLAGYRPTEDVVELDRHRAADAHVSLERVPLPRREVRELPRPATDGPGVKALTWVALGVGAAAFGTALAIEMADHEGTGIARPSAFLGGVGLAGSALGGVMLYMDMSAIAR